MDKEQGKFRDVVKKCTSEVCGMRHVMGIREIRVSGKVKSRCGIGRKDGGCERDVVCTVNGKGA